MTTHNYEELDEHVGSRGGDNHPRILLMGLKGSGKTSIYNVIFKQMHPEDTRNLESTTVLHKNDNSDFSFFKFHLWDCPGQLVYTDPSCDQNALFSEATVIVFIIDISMDDYSSALNQLCCIISASLEHNPYVKFHLFLHKIDCYEEEQRYEQIKKLNDAIDDELGKITNSEMLKHIAEKHFTTIYDYSIYVAFSDVVQKMIPQLPGFESLINAFIYNCNMEKVFLFDIATKIFLASDSEKTFIENYEICCDMIDLIYHILSIYSDASETSRSGMSAIPHQQQQQTPPSANASGAVGEIFSSDVSSIIRLDTGFVLYLRGINRHLALVCYMRESALEKQGIIEYNFETVRNGILQVLSVPVDDDATSPAGSAGSGREAERGGGDSPPAIDSAAALDHQVNSSGSQLSSSAGRSGYLR